MVKIVKVSNEWPQKEINYLVDQFAEKGVDAIVIKDSELEVYDGNLEKIDIECGEQVVEERFSGEGTLGIVND